MVRREIWERVQGGKGMLCIACLETRLGRPLNAFDFTTALCNTVTEWHSELLRHRLNHIPEYLNETAMDAT